ncbi:MAG TPA: DUF4339 domain-containing protein [Candidatus Angelobacter sp.]|nr:DUF4339 domain-containing protein [Candidatus Angelobacter sp.]
MKYYIQRQLNEYGPYTLADLQRYVAQGNVQLTDLARSEGMTDWMPVSQVLGNIPIAVPPLQPSAPVYAGGGTGTVYGGPGTAYGSAAPMPVMNVGPMPTDFHWALVLVIAVITCGLFGWAWLFVEAAYVKKIKSDSKGIIFAIIALVVAFGGGFIRGFSNAMNGEPNPASGLVSLVAIALVLVALFQMKSDLEEYYNTTEPINLRLNGVMVFFFGILYLQHHLSRIAQWKKTGFLSPQG